jgi:HK97 family phage major capsid protein
MSMHERRVKAADRVHDHLEIKDITAALAKRDEEIKSFAEKASAEIKDHGKILDETKSALTKLSEGGQELQDRLMQVEQKLAKRPLGDPAAFDGKSLGKQLTESDDFKAMQAKGRGTVTLQVKDINTITSSTANADGAVGDAIVPHRLPGIVSAPDRVLTIRDLISQSATTSNAIEYVEERGFQNSAAAVAENPVSAKPKSDISFELKTTTVKTLAHIFKVSKQALDDVPALQGYIDNRGRYGLKSVEENQLLFGDGTGNNLLGLWPQATLFDQTSLSRPTTDTPIDTLRRSMLQARLAEYRATGLVLHPEDWAEIELQKTEGAGADGRYIWSNPRALAAPGLWGLPVVDTMAMPKGQFMAGAFAIAATVFDRQQATVEIANQNEDDFVKNLLTIRIEERLALAVFRPESFVKGFFDLDSPSQNA